MEKVFLGTQLLAVGGQVVQRGFLVPAWVAQRVRSVDFLVGCVGFVLPFCLY